MPFNVRSIAVNLAVISFFILSLVAFLSGLSPLICCKRAVIGAVFVYITGSLTIKLINIILLDAMITKYNEQISNSELTKNKKMKTRGNSGAINN